MNTDLLPKDYCTVNSILGFILLRDKKSAFITEELLKWKFPSVKLTLLFTPSKKKIVTSIKNTELIL